MKLKLFLLGVLYSSLCMAQTDDEKAIRELLSKQTTAWNQGNIEGFMKGYWENDSLMFIGKSGVTWGWKKTLDNYKRNYPDKTAMGQLFFRPVGDETIVVRVLPGRWQMVIKKNHW